MQNPQKKGRGYSRKATSLLPTSPSLRQQTLSPSTQNGHSLPVYPSAWSRCVFVGIFAYPHTPCAYFRLQRLRSADLKKIGFTHGLLLDFLPPTLNFFIVSAHFQFAVRSVQSARSTANRLAEFGFGKSYFGVLNICLWGISSPRWHAYHREKIIRRIEWRQDSPIVGKPWQKL